MEIRKRISSLAKGRGKPPMEIRERLQRSRTWLINHSLNKSFMVLQISPKPHFSSNWSNILLTVLYCIPSNPLLCFITLIIFQRIRNCFLKHQPSLFPLQEQIYRCEHSDHPRKAPTSKPKPFSRPSNHAIRTRTKVQIRSHLQRDCPGDDDIANERTVSFFNVLPNGREVSALAPRLYIGDLAQLVVAEWQQHAGQARR